MKHLTLLATLGTILISLPLGAQITNSGTPAVTAPPTSITTPATTPNLDPGNTNMAQPNLNQSTNSPVNNTGVETGTGVGTGFAPIAPANPGNTPAATNPMGGWQGK